MAPTKIIAAIEVGVIVFLVLNADHAAGTPQKAKQHPANNPNNESILPP
jgi:hypothetical protein